MALAERIWWGFDPHSFGGVVPERLIAAIVLCEGLYAGLVFTFGDTGPPKVEFWERIDDLERQGFLPISQAKARALCPLVRFLEQLERAADT